VRCVPRRSCSTNEIPRAGMVRQREGAMSGAQAAALGMLAPTAGVAAMQGLLLDLAASRSPRSAAGVFDCCIPEAQGVERSADGRGSIEVAEAYMYVDRQMSLPLVHNRATF
jgi:hypothetical protein